MILDYINRNGPSTVDELASASKVVTVTARAHLAVLERENLVVGREVRTGRAGRPRVHYALTPESSDVFPKGYDHLALRLLQTLGSDEARQEFITEAAAAWATTVADSVKHGDRREMIEAAIAALDETGCEADWQEDEGRLEIRLHNCPYTNVVERFPELCEMERTFLENLLKYPVSVTESGPGCSECVMVAEPHSIPAPTLPISR